MSLPLKLCSLLVVTFLAVGAKADCSLGEYLLNGVCTPCPAGSYSNSTTATQCITCPLGYYRSQLGASFCFACSAGRYIDYTGASLCLGCGIGRYQDESAKSTCKPCPRGTYKDTNTGLETSCRACVAGRYSNEEGNTHVGKCLACPVGTSSSVTGASSCTQCAAGTITSVESQKSCASCPAGKVTTVAGLSTCTNCTVGTFAHIASMSICYNCSAGTYALNATGQQTCQKCPTGQITERELQYSCTTCASGTYTYSGSSLCLPCQFTAYECPTTPPTGFSIRDWTCFGSIATAAANLTDNAVIDAQFLSSLACQLTRFDPCAVSTDSDPRRGLGLFNSKHVEEVRRLAPTSAYAFRPRLRALETFALGSPLAADVYDSVKSMHALALLVDSYYTSFKARSAQVTNDCVSVASCVTDRIRDCALLQYLSNGVLSNVTSDEILMAGVVSAHQKGLITDSAKAFLGQTAATLQFYKLNSNLPKKCRIGVSTTSDSNALNSQSVTSLIVSARINTNVTQFDRNTALANILTWTSNRFPNADTEAAIVNTRQVNGQWFVDIFYSSSDSSAPNVFVNELTASSSTLSLGTSVASTTTISVTVSSTPFTPQGGSSPASRAQLSAAAVILTTLLSALLSFMYN